MSEITGRPPLKQYGDRAGERRSRLVRERRHGAPP